MKVGKKRYKLIKLKCSNPRLVSSINTRFYVRCGGCLSCRVDKRRRWGDRIKIEAKAYAQSSFVTLTYDDTHLPEGGSLSLEDHRYFMMRFRSRIAPEKVRFFVAGEYGGLTWRPHLHYALFGYEPCRNGRTRNDQESCCGPCDALRAAWGKGFVDNIALTGAEAYLSGYTVKGMTRPDHVELGGRRPEFARMSLKPGIGAAFVPRICEGIEEHQLQYSMQDVPAFLLEGKRGLVLGPYLRRKLRQEFFGSPETPEAVKLDYFEQFDAVAAVAEMTGKTVKDVLVEESSGIIAGMEFWEQFNSKSKL